jgi:phosphinothricin acetyltransferase
MRIRPAEVTDAEAIGAIYNREVTESTSTLDLVPRSLDEQRRWISDRSGGLAVIVADDDGEIAGFASLSFYRDRPGYRTSVENSIYVAPTHRRTGVGSLLLAELIEVASQHGFHAMFARVVGPQPASLRLHEQHGFWLVGTEKQVARKFGHWHDVALLQRLLT